MARRSRCDSGRARSTRPLYLSDAIAADERPAVGERRACSPSRTSGAGTSVRAHAAQKTREIPTRCVAPGADVGREERDERFEGAAERAGVLGPYGSHRIAHADLLREFRAPRRPASHSPCVPPAASAAQSSTVIAKITWSSHFPAMRRYRSASPSLSGAHLLHDAQARHVARHDRDLHPMKLGRRRTRTRSHRSPLRTSARAAGARDRSSTRRTRSGTRRGGRPRG